MDTETLCVLAGQRVWSIRVDVRVCDHQGNLHDACVLAAVAALASFRRPDVTVIGNKVTVHSTDERHPVPLTIHYFPIANTYAFYQSRLTHFLLEPIPILDYLPLPLCSYLGTPHLNSYRLYWPLLLSPTFPALWCSYPFSLLNFPLYLTSNDMTFAVPYF